jgi:5'-3' exonuclease
MILIDYSAIAIASVSTLPAKEVLDENLVRHMILNSLRMHRAKHRRAYGELVICADGSQNWRKEAFPQYKYRRRDDRNVSSRDWVDVWRITNMILQEIRENFPYKIVENVNTEADDIIGVLCAETQEFGKGEDVLIISSDKDFAQLQKYNNVRQYSPVKKKFIVEEHPRQQLIELICKGDRADGIPNVLSPDNCFVDGIRQTPLKAKILEQLISDPESQGPEVFRNFQRNYKLICLEETPAAHRKEIIYNYESQEPAKQNVLKYLVEKRCRLLIESVGDFV